MYQNKPNQDYVHLSQKDKVRIIVTNKTKKPSFGKIVFARFHDLFDKNLVSLLFNIIIKEKGEPGIEYDIHEVKNIALDVITANYMCIR